MIDVTTIDPMALPRLPIERKNKLPACPSIYFVIEAGELVYIGKAKNLKRRWQNHHKINEVSPDSCIAWLVISDIFSLYKLESQFVDLFTPKLNDICKVVRLPQNALRDGLGQKIKEARKKSPKTLKGICDEVGLSRSYWGKVEDGFIKNGLPIEVLRKIESALDVDFEIKFTD